MIDLKRCTRCGKSFEDIIAHVELNLQVFRLTDSGVPEEIANLFQTSKEYLCKECFDDFAEIASKMNLEHGPEVQHIEEKCEPEIQIVEDVKYDE